MPSWMPKLDMTLRAALMVEQGEEEVQVEEVEGEEQST